MAGSEAVVRITDMNKQMLQDAVDCAAYALTKYKEQKGIAQFMKKEFDAKYSTKWHVVVGKDFGSYVTHEVKVGQLGHQTKHCTLYTGFLLFFHRRFGVPPMADAPTRGGHRGCQTAGRGRGQIQLKNGFAEGSYNFFTPLRLPPST
eukprot:TRINITY_DN17365_c0_g1_i2.p1 TRINITY_DN17365_c0_g1~~TRINITY_DN17365_c0_g1_i2.p1  ORF type:complete len:147 (+),score=3.79 TRINITY_DN17365_c0_g1_i2:76-516(+)